MKRTLRQACLIGLVVVVTSIAAQSQGLTSKSAQRFSELNNQIARQSEKESLGVWSTKSINAAKERHRLLSEMIESSPADALRYGLSSDQLAKIPARYADLFENRVELSGELTVIAECEENNFKTERFVTTKDGKYSVYFQDAPDQQSGSTMDLAGISVDGKVAVESYNVTQAAALPGTTGERKVLVILVNFQDKQTQPYTVERARDVAFNTTSNFLRENSYGQTWLTGDVYGWYTIPVSSTSCDIDAIGGYARSAAANAGANISQYTSIVYAFPPNACGFSGTASVGGSPGQVWIRGDYFGLEVLGHELGHNYGLMHSRSMDCGTEVINGTCTVDEYGDQFDLMGPGAPYHYNAYQKERLGWLNSGSSPTVQSVSSNGTYYIEAYETAGSGPKGLKILRSVDPVSGARSWYYIEHRTPTGFDSGLSSYNIQNGVIFHSGQDGNGQENYLLDMTPLTASWYDSFLLQGQTYTDAGLGLIVTVLSADSAGATLQVQVAAQACVRANPTVSVTPGQSAWMQAGAPFTYQVSVRNNNSGGCSDESFNLGASLPSGFSVSYSNSSLSLPNGASGNLNVNVASGASSSDGTYNLAFSVVNAANPAYFGSASAQYVQVSQLGVTATPGSPTYNRSQTATITSYVKAAGVPVAGASVRFTFTKPNTRPYTVTVVADSNGKAVFSYKFYKKSDGIGTYLITAASTVNGVSGQASTSFVVTR